MGKPFKRQRIKTGQNTWINRTIGPNGVKESYSNKCGNVTYNHNPKRGNRMWTNFAGWTQSTRTSNSKTKKLPLFFKSSKKSGRSRKAATQYIDLGGEPELSVALMAIGIPLLTIFLAWVGVPFIYGIVCSYIAYVISVFLFQEDSKLLFAGIPLFCLLSPVVWVALFIIYVLCEIVS